MKYNVKITLFLVILFLLSQIVGLIFINNDIEIVKVSEGPDIVIHPETAIGPRPDVEVESGESVFLVLTGVFIGTMLLLLIIKFAKVNYWKLMFFIAVLTTMTISLGVFFEPLSAFIIALALTLIKIFRPTTIIHNITELLIYSGIAVLFVPLFNLFWIVVLLLIISAYDAFAVWQSRHMVKLAKFQTGSGLFAGLMVNFEKEPPARKKTKKTKKPKKLARTAKTQTVTRVKEVRQAILGGGDIAFPLIFAGVVMESLIPTIGKEMAFLKTLIIPIVLSIVLVLMLMKGKQDRFYPAMPFLTAGCLIGWLIVSII